MKDKKEEIIDMDATRLAARAWNIDIPIVRYPDKTTKANEFSDEVERYVKLLGFKTKRKK